MSDIVPIWHENGLGRFLVFAKEGERWMLDDYSNDLLELLSKIKVGEMDRVLVVDGMVHGRLVAIQPTADKYNIELAND